MPLKPGVKLNGIKPELLVAMMEARAIWTTSGFPFVVTSVCDGTHMRGSEHYSGCAFDLRVIPDPVRQAQAVADLKQALGIEFDVIWESQGTPNEHVHVEYQPKGPGP